MDQRVPKELCLSRTVLDTVDNLCKRYLLSDFLKYAQTVLPS